MAQDGMKEYQQERANQLADNDQVPEMEQEQRAPAIAPAAAANLLKGPLAGAQRRSVVQNVAQNFGNRQVQRMLGTVRRSASSGPEGGALEENLAQKIQSERSKGQSLDASVRREVEQTVGHDLSPVRVHTDSTSSELNQQLGAKAFTSGRDIFFGEGHSPTDRELITHEATHTVQQGFSEAAPSSVGAANTSHEQAADHAAAHAGSASGGVQREAAPEEEELQAKRDDAVQREGEEEEVQAKRDDAVQREGEEEEPPSATTSVPEEEGVGNKN